MTYNQLNLFNLFYLVVLVVTIVITRPTVRRLCGALAGAAVAGVLVLVIIAFCVRVGWWRFVMPRDFYFLTLLWICVLLGAFVFLITWRIARRFGGYGLAVALLVVAIGGPLRDSFYMANFPGWGEYGPGMAPMLAISFAYVLTGVVGHGIMRLVSGPAELDRLARSEPA